MSKFWVDTPKKVMDLEKMVGEFKYYVKCSFESYQPSNLRTTEIHALENLPEEVNSVKCNQPPNSFACERFRNNCKECSRKTFE